MPEQDAGGSSISTAQSFANSLITRLQSGDFSTQKASWVSGLNITDPVTTSMSWASDANAYVCSTALAPGLSYLENTDLAGDYYNQAQPVFEQLLARAGVRLAAWLDLIAQNVGSGA